MFSKTAACLIITMASLTQALADPTLPAPGRGIEQAESAANQPSLDAIFVTESGRKAVIDGNIYLEAQQKNGLTVIHIGKNDVEVEYLKNGERTREMLSLASATFVSKSETDKK